MESIAIGLTVLMLTAHPAPPAARPIETALVQLAHAQGQKMSARQTFPPTSQPLTNVASRPVNRAVLIALGALGGLVAGYYLAPAFGRHDELALPVGAAAGGLFTFWVTQ